MNTEQKDNRIHLYTRTMDIRWGDMDALGHVNNMIYFQYFEDTRAAWLASIGEEACISGNTPIGPVLVTAQANYLKPLIYPATVDIIMLAEQPGNSSLKTLYEVRNHTNQDELFCTGETMMVWANHEAGKSTRIPEEIRAKINT